MILKSVVDTHAREANPATEYGGLARLWVRGTAGSAAKYAYIWFPKQVPIGAKVLSAVLRLRLSGAWSGTNNLTAKRITQKWKEGTLNWNNKPTVTTTNQEAVTVTGGVDKQLVEFDVTDIIQDVANGGGFFGFRIELSQNVDRAFRSGEDALEIYRPQLELEWSESPDPPDRLAPDGEDAVSTDSPLLSWRFSDKVGTGDGALQESSQVQISADPADFAGTPDFDTGKVANDLSEYDLTLDGPWDGSLLPDAATLYWRVKVWDGTDFESDWSEIAEFQRDDLGSLVIDEPGATVPETTPPVIWTLTGETQGRYRVTLFRIEADLDVTQLWQIADVGTDNSVTIAPGFLVSGSSYRVQVEVWDDVPRVGDEHLTESVDFTYARDTTPDAVETLSAATVSGSPEVVLTWTRTVAPDYFALVVDGVEVLDRIDPADFLTVPNTYEMGYWGATPREEHTYEIEAVVLDSGIYRHSGPNPEVEAITKPVGIWLVDEADSTAVQIVGKESAEFGINESAATFEPVGARALVRITDIVRGYRGPVKGQILGASARDSFLELKRRRKNLTLVVGDLAFPIRMEEAACTPTASPGDLVFVISFEFFQSGPPWPVP